ncbi:hypothetical protein PMAYCL1PPCAC_00475 [Pristionchus mayeri]|uniref:Uncharacterized protein n=1 Tax=Pristionchus mayeri TaxID=1317129 RepID=A0AAN4Z2Y1_9BILA|nr:hypothetical protein PMAYCL1PPCAC_00475 [Pristionchus mayeri]
MRAYCSTRLRSRLIATVEGEMRLDGWKPRFERLFFWPTSSVLRTFSSQQFECRALYCGVHVNFEARAVTSHTSSLDDASSRGIS